MSLDDELKKAREQADRREEQARRQWERERQERAAAQKELAKVSELLAPFGDEGLIRVEPAKLWHLFPRYKGANGTDYRLVSAQPCWTVLELRDGIGDGRYKQRRILLMSDGSIGELDAERTDITPKGMPIFRTEYLSTSDLKQVTEETIGLRGGASYLDGLRKVLAEAIVKYERAGVRRRVED
jgi:hypothetical protein